MVKIKKPYKKEVAVATTCKKPIKKEVAVATTCKICTKRYVCAVLEKIYELDGAYSEIISNHPEEQWPKNVNVVADTLRMLMPKICPEFIEDTTEMSIKLRTMMMELSSYKQSRAVIKSARRKK